MLLEFVGEDAERGDVVFDLLKCGENGFAIIGDGVIVICLGLLDGSAARAEIENRFAGAGADGEKARRPGEPLRDGSVFETGAAQRE